ETALGPNHPDVGIRLNNLAGLLQEMGDYAAARPLYERALRIAEMALGPAHPSVGVRLNNLAGLLRAMKDDAGARPLYERALRINEQALGAMHPIVATRRSAACVQPRSRSATTSLFSRASRARHGAIPAPARRRRMRSSPLNRRSAGRRRLRSRGRAPARPLAISRRPAWRARFRTST